LAQSAGAWSICLHGSRQTCSRPGPPCRVRASRSHARAIPCAAAHRAANSSQGCHHPRHTCAAAGVGAGPVKEAAGSRAPPVRRPAAGLSGGPQLLAGPTRLLARGVVNLGAQALPLVPAVLAANFGHRRQAVPLVPAALAATLGHGRQALPLVPAALAANLGHRLNHCTRALPSSLSMIRSDRLLEVLRTTPLLTSPSVGEVVPCPPS